MESDGFDHLITFDDFITRNSGRSTLVFILSWWSLDGPRSCAVVSPASL